jgi:HK97 family phage portal protein
MKFKDRLQRAFSTFHSTGSKAAAVGSFLFPGSYQYSGRGGFLSVARRDFPYQNTDPMANSAVANCLAWITRNFPQAELKVCREKRDGTKEPLPDHPMLELLSSPNPGYGAATMWAAVMLSYHLDGNAYLIKVRNARGRGIPIALWYEPHWTIRPHWPTDGSQWIDYYERRVNGQIEKIPPQNVIHIKNGLNPANPRFGMAPIKSALLNIFSDVEVDLWVAALCRNMAIPGVVVSPEEAIGLTEDKARAIKERWKERFGGDNRGEPLILDFKATVETLGFDPQSMDFKAIHDQAESRIAGALGVPPTLAFLNVSNEGSTYNNLTTFERIGFEQGIVPSYECIEDELDRQLLPDFEQNRAVYTEFDTSNIRALKEDEDKRQARCRENLKAGLITINEARSDLGLGPLSGADYFLLPSNVRPATPETVASRAAAEITDPKPTGQPAEALPKDNEGKNE